MMRAIVGGGTALLAVCLLAGALAEPPRGEPARFAVSALAVPAAGVAAAVAPAAPVTAGTAGASAAAAAPVTAGTAGASGDPAAPATVGTAGASGDSAAPVTAGTAGASAAAATPPGSGLPVTAGDGGSVATAGAGDAALVDAGWATAVGARTGIPVRALVAYAGAALRLLADQPTCHLGWNTLAALGDIESAHGTHAGSAIDTDGTARPAIYGPALDGGSYANIPDSDGGALDGSSGGDRAVGPLQFIPSTWQRWGADGNGDGVADPQQLDDAALAAGRYLCSYGDLAAPGGWRASIFAYNHLDSYVDAVARAADEYAAQAG